MKKYLNPAVGLAATLTLLSLSGCMALRDKESYRYEHGDRIGGDGTRYVGWCYAHPRNIHCLNQASPEPQA